ncbi:MAG TPA: MarR family transcriptional regulator [Bacteroidia bacterium]|jgi:DNA-binding MarR family transcriptional regulator|nr:MarR family transcriptional regulator [Bacteroidia bacterium]
MKNNRSGSFIYLLERTLRQSKSVFQEMLNAKKADITVDQWIVMEEISRKNEVSQSELAKLSAKDPASITRILALLEEKKLVQRTASASDKRKIQVRLTSKGKATLARCAKCVDQFREVAGKNITQAELNHQREILNKFYENCGGKEL